MPDRHSPTFELAPNLIAAKTAHSFQCLIGIPLRSNHLFPCSIPDGEGAFQCLIGIPLRSNH